MNWDDYSRAILRLNLPEGEIKVAPAAFGRRKGRFPGDGRLFHIITAHNPGGQLLSPEDNALAQSRLVARAADTALEHYPAAGGDRGCEHVEQGLAVVGLDRGQACALGRDFGQEAIFEWSPAGLAVVGCEDEDSPREHFRGWVSSPVNDTAAPGATSTAVPHAEPKSHAAQPMKHQDPGARFNRTAAGEESGEPAPKDQDRFVYVGPVFMGDHLAVISEKSAAYHRWFVSAVESATTYGQVRAILHGPLEDEADDDDEEDLPSDDDPFDVLTCWRTYEGQYDWFPDEATVDEWSDLLADLGVPDTGEPGLDYQPRDFVLPLAAQDQIVARLSERGWSVQVVPSIDPIWWDRCPTGLGADAGGG